MPPATQVKAVSSLLFPAQPILQGTVMVAHNPTSQPQSSSSTTHHQRPDTADTSSSSPTFPLLSILNVDHVMMPLSPMEPMEFREVCRWNNNGNSDDVFSGESKGTKEGDDGGVESVADEGAIHQPKQP